MFWYGQVGVCFWVLDLGVSAVGLFVMGLVHWLVFCCVVVGFGVWVDCCCS